MRADMHPEGMKMRLFSREHAPARRPTLRRFRFAPSQGYEIPAVNGQPSAVAFTREFFMCERAHPEGDENEAIF